MKTKYVVVLTVETTGPMYKKSLRDTVTALLGRVVYPATGLRRGGSIMEIDGERITKVRVRSVDVD